MANLRVLGLWRSDQRPDLPDPTDLVDPGWGRREKNEVEWYLASGSRGRTYMGYSACRICGQETGSGEYTDGTYVWPEGLLHYVVSHDVRLPAEFVGHALARRSEIDEAPRDEAWWLASTAQTPSP